MEKRGRFKGFDSFRTEELSAGILVDKVTVKSVSVERISMRARQSRRMSLRAHETLGKTLSLSLTSLPEHICSYLFFSSSITLHSFLSP
jgi:hypothetical protein